jgi:hypothetical protein
MTMPAERIRMVPVPLIDVAVPIIAEPGDRLLVINGVCIGVDTSRAVAAPKDELLAIPAPPPKRKRAAAKKSGRKYAKKPPSPLVESAIAVLRKAGEPLTLALITKTLGISYTNDSLQYHQVYHAFTAGSAKHLVVSKRKGGKTYWQLRVQEARAA